MRRWLWTAILVAFSGVAQAQNPPLPAAAAYVNPGSGFAPWAAGLGSGAITPQPPGVALYCSSNGIIWTPCNPGGGTGTVVAVTATPPLVSSGGTDPAISLSTATWVDVRAYGAVGDGVTDNCTALTNAAAAAAGTTLFVPNQVFDTSCAITLPVNTSLQIQSNGSIQAKTGSTMAAVVIAGGSTQGQYWADQTIQGGGTIDANNVATRALWLRQSSRGRLFNLHLLNAAGVACLQNGDTADGLTGSNSLDAVEVWCYRTSGSVVAGSYGIWDDNASDAKYVQGYVKGYAIAIRNDVGGTKYSLMHVWNTNVSGAMTTCFYDNAQGNWWDDNVCDTPTQYGAVIANYSSHWSNNRFELSATYGVTNTAIAFHSPNADPVSFFVNNEFTATALDGTMVWAQDFDFLPFAGMQSEFIANRPTEVTTSIGVNDYLRSNNSLGSDKGFGAHTMNSSNQVTYSTTPTIGLNYQNIQFLTLTGNVTAPTWTSTGAFEFGLMDICMDSTGGRTVNWGRALGMGVPFTGANQCSYQPIYDNTHYISATGPMMDGSGDASVGGSISAYGSLTLNAATTPSAPTVTVTGAAAGTVAYECQGIDLNAGATAVSAATSITNSGATLSGTVYNNVSCQLAPGANYENVIRSTNGLGLSTGVIGTQVYGNGNSYVQDTGQSATAIPTAGTSGAINLTSAVTEPLSVGSGVSSEAQYIGVNAERARFGFDSSNGNAIIEGNTSKGVGFLCNSGTFGAGYCAIVDQNKNFGVGTSSTNGTNDAFYVTAAGAAHALTLNVATARKGTFVCTAAGTISISNTNELITSDVIISLNTAGGTISTASAMKTVTSGTGFSVLCGAADTSTYNYDIIN